jgi:hypothetical protein
MYLTIEGESRSLIPIKDFRAAQGLPPDFGVAFFEPKDYDGLGRIDRAGAELNRVRAALLDALPEQMDKRGWLAFLPDYARLFEDQLYTINDHVGLKDVEIEFAVAGLSDVLHHLAYGLLRGGVNFRQVYSEWLDNSLKVFSQVYNYEHQGRAWQVQIIAHAYGRTGLVIHAGDETFYVYDTALGCPAEGFMATLLFDIAARMFAATA